MKLNPSLAVLLAFMPLCIHARGIESVCDVSRYPSRYVGRYIRLVGQVAVGMHGSSIVDARCIENRIPLDLESNSAAASDFDEVMSVKNQGNKSPPVLLAGRVEVRGEASFFVPESIKRLDASGVERP
jgi:hypothetical protein